MHNTQQNLNWPEMIRYLLNCSLQNVHTVNTFLEMKSYSTLKKRNSTNVCRYLNSIHMSLNSSSFQFYFLSFKLQFFILFSTSGQIQKQALNYPLILTLFSSNLGTTFSPLVYFCIIQKHPNCSTLTSLLLYFYLAVGTCPTSLS